MAPFLSVSSSDNLASLPQTPSPPANGTAAHGPLTIADWRAVQLADGGAGAGLERLLALVEAERRANAKTRAWVSLASPQLMAAQWRRLLAAPSPDALPLFGVPFAVKDNIDVEGLATTAACPAFSDGPAGADAPVVARLKAAGAVAVGKTNMDQFATGLVGTRSPLGAVPNALDAARVAGGSSSGSAVVVARGAVPFSLGTDTAGSGRVPAGLNNVVGLKPSRGALSARGVLPACRTLDCVSVFALTVDDARAVLAVAEAYDDDDAYSRRRPGAEDPAARGPVFGAASPPGAPPALAVCGSPDWFGRDDHAPAYEAALGRARALGWQLTPVDLSPLFALARLLYEGPWVAERYAAIRDFMQRAAPEDIDPVVRGIVSKARGFSAADTFAAEYLRQDLARSIAAAFRGFDGLLVPTTPTFPTVEQVLADPVRENSLLGTYTNFVNLLDWTAVAVPAGFRADGLPFSITLISAAWQEPRLIGLAQQWLAGAPRRLGATDAFREADGAPEEPVEAPVGTEPGTEPIAVVGAHLAGFPLNKDLVSRGAKLSAATTTSAMYRLYELDTPGPRKPGLERVASALRGQPIAVEVWDLPRAALPGFVATIRPPLALGSVELADGRWVRGFVCEPVGLRGARDITGFGGWRAFAAHAQCNGVCRLPSPGPPCSGPPWPRPPCRSGARRRLARVLVANRGEIAARIIRSLHRLGIEAVSVYADADAGAPHVGDADLALRLEGVTVAETYLDGAQVLRLARAVGADAVIPGYGFLSENAGFARAVEAAGLVWVGPTPEQMADLGLKHRARAIAEASGVAAVPGSASLVTSLAEARAEARRLGFPLMLKSTAGGGGIGLRCCRDAASLDEAFGAVGRLAAANFGDAGVFLERYIANARHVEVQVLGDGAGRVVAAGERDCSLQRRHQKVVEESPAPALPPGVRAEMRAAAVRLAAAVKYRSVGTVEFIYDVDARDFFFLEVNTRLQVEHPVTEAVTGLDLVECMLDIAADDAGPLFAGPPSAAAVPDAVPVAGASVEVRLYAESPLQGFRPCAGTISALAFPPGLRVDTWVGVGTAVSTRYDPLLAKLVATGRDRGEALERLAAGLAATVVKGVETNLDYLRQVVTWPLFQAGTYTTTSLDAFRFVAPSLQVLEPGAMTTVQDFPGRTGFWNVGIPPSGPMDHVSFRLANRLVGNGPDAAALECTLQGPALRFHRDAVVAVTGASAPVTVDDEPVAAHRALVLRAGQTLAVGPVVDAGYRVYVAVAGGIAVPRVMGSRATFEVGSLGGKDGGRLRRGDVVPLGAPPTPEAAPEAAPEAPPVAPAVPIPANACWTVGVVPGPHGAPDYFTAAGLETLFAAEWRVHHNSNRLGVRLTGPRPQWARPTGGEAGLHPSNIHDSPYSVGSISFTGDEAVVLTCDGPSLGGFVVFCVVAAPEMWKLGQARPGDVIRLRAIDTELAARLDRALTGAIDHLGDLPRLDDLAAEATARSPAIAGAIDCGGGGGGGTIVVRQAGDRCVVLEFGDADVFDMRQSFHIQAFCRSHASCPVDGIVEVTPGVRTIHISYAPGLLPDDVLARLSRRVSSYAVATRVPSRTLRLPLTFDDSVSRAAVERYAATIRPDAPWLPSNVAFLEQLNGLDDVSGLLYDATFLVLGLGDVFLGSPCAVPLDPRHRLFGTKYNPSRSFTPHRSVGIGGQYMCIYATDSPGGYQLVGRTVDIWDPKRISTGDAEPTVVNGSPDTADPCMFRPFDRITFYPVDELELDARPASQLITITEGELDLEEYEAWTESNKDDIAATAARRQESISSAPFLDELRQPYRPKAMANGADDTAQAALNLGGEKVKAMVPGRCYNFVVKENAVVRKGDILMWIESSKMEIEIRSPVGGRCTRVPIKEGSLVDAGEILVTIEPTCE